MSPVAISPAAVRGAALQAIKRSLEVDGANCPPGSNVEIGVGQLAITLLQHGQEDEHWPRRLVISHRCQIVADFRWGDELQPVAYVLFEPDRWVDELFAFVASAHSGAGVAVQ